MFCIHMLSKKYCVSISLDGSVSGSLCLSIASIILALLIVCKEYTTTTFAAKSVQMHTRLLEVLPEYISYYLVLMIVTMSYHVMPCG